MGLAEVASNPHKAYLLRPSQLSSPVFSQVKEPCFGLLIWKDQWLWLDKPLCANSAEVVLARCMKITVRCTQCNESILPMVWCSECKRSTCIKCNLFFVVPEEHIVNFCMNCGSSLMTSAYRRYLQSIDDVSVSGEKILTEQSNGQFSRVRGLVEYSLPAIPRCLHRKP